jgi:nucleoside-diphosphate-sugar epimerase
MPERTAVVTGGAGFLGSHLVEELARRKWRVRVIDDLSNGSRSNLSAVKGKVDFRRASILNPKAMGAAFRGAEVVFHLAAKVSVAESIEKPELYARVNVAGLIQALEAARRHDVKRFIFPSSAAVYAEKGPARKTEKSPLRPVSPYAVTKVLGEALCRVYHEDYGLGTVSLRLFNIYGARQAAVGGYASVIPKFMRAIAEGKRPEVHGDGKQTRDFVHVGDVVTAFLLAAERKGVSGEEFNIGSGKAVSIIALLDLIRTAAGSKVQPKFVAARQGEVRDSCASIAKAKGLLGFQPKVSLAEGLAGLGRQF